MSSGGSAGVFVLVNTRNRKDETRNALRSALAQTVPVRLIVVDDGSTDGTSDMVRAEFPDAILVRNEECRGVLEARNKGARIAVEGGSNILFVLDDDAVFSTPNVIAQTLPRFNHPRVGAVAIPLLNFIGDKRIDPDRFTEVCPGEFTVTFSFRGGACAMRADLFLALGGYKGHMGHAEEGNYCARMIDAGYVTRGGGGIDYVHHFPSPNRNPRGITRLKSINNLLFAWHNVPAPELFVHSTGVWVKMLRYGVKQRHVAPAIGGLFEGAWRSVTDFKSRQPISRRAYRMTRLLTARNSVGFDEIEAALPAMRELPGVHPLEAFVTVDPPKTPLKAA